MTHFDDLSVTKKRQLWKQLGYAGRVLDNLENLKLEQLCEHKRAWLRKASGEIQIDVDIPVQERVEKVTV